MANQEQQAFLQELEDDYEEPGPMLFFVAGGGLTVSVARAAGQGDPVNAGPINFTVTFSAPATGFTNTDVTFSGSTVGGTLAAAVTGTGPSYNVAVTGMTGSGLVQVSIPAAAATNATGTPFPASNSITVMFDTTQPSVTINKAATQDDPTSMPTIMFTAVFSEAVIGFTAADVSTAGSTATGTLAVSLMGSGPTYSVIVTGATGSGNVVASIPAGAVTDAAGNTSLASTSTDNVVAFNTSIISDYPDQTNTGFIPGSTLTPSGSVNTSADGQLIQNLDISGGMSIDHNNVTVRNCRIRSTTGAHLIWVHDTVTGTTQFIDCTVDGLNNTPNTFFLGSNGPVTILRCNIFGSENGVNIAQNNVTVKDSYVHNLQTTGSDPHYDVIEINSGCDNLLIDHCTLVLDNHTATACVNYNNFFGTPSPSNSLIIQNSKIIDGGAFPILADGRFQATPLSNITVQNNLIRKATSTGFFYFFPNVRNLTWINNTDIDTSTSIPNPGTDFDNSGNPFSNSFAALDGRLNAPIAAPQYPTLLNGYATRPPWQVAGVDYAVGYPSGTVLKNPNTIALAGTSINTTTHEVFISGAGVTLDAYDFSLNNGWGIVVDAANFTVTNSKFIVGSNNLVPIDGTDNGTNIRVAYCIIDGQDHNPGTGALINSDAGNLTVEYCQIENSGGDIIQYSPLNGTLLLRWSILGDAGMAAGAHGDYIQSVSDTGSITFTTKFCLGLQNRVVVATQGFMAEPSGISIAGVELGNCTLIARPVGAAETLTFWIGITCPDLTGAATIHDNYMDLTGAFGLSPGSIRGGPDDAFPLTTYTGNIDMVTGLASNNDSFPDATNTGPAAGTVFTNQSGEITTTGAGQTIEKRNITAGYIYIRHANTIVQDCIVDMTGLAPASFFQAISAANAAAGCTIRRCKVIGNAGKDCIQTEFLTNVDISFCDLSKMENGISIGSDGGNIHDNYIHDLLGSGTPHVDGIQGTGLFNGLTINHNTIISYDTSGIIMQTEFGGFSNVTITNNRLLNSAPISFGILIQETTPGAVSNVSVTNNRIKSDVAATPTFEYAVFHNVKGLNWANNVDDTTDALINYRDDGGNTAPATDNFNRANGALGANWGTDRDPITIVSNQAKSSTSGNSVAIRTAETFAANQYSQIVWQGGLNNGAGPVVRHNGSNPGSYYVAFLNAATDALNIYSVTAGSYSSKALAGVPIVNGDVLRLEASGSTIRVLLNGVEKLSVTNTDRATGRPGFEIFNTTVAIDDWGGGEL